ncbi:MAG: thermonuclease family protein [Candidatus Omnitrophota bacterium]
MYTTITKKLQKFTFFLLILTLAGCLKSDSKQLQSQKAFFVSRVIDGDTIELSTGKRIRYIGIDTPEVRKKTAGSWQYDPKPYSLEASNYNKSLVEGKEVILEFDVEKQDKYSRWLAYVYKDGKMVNEELLKQGYAKVLVIPPNTKYRSRLNIAQTEAQQAHRGLWK